MSSFVMPEHVPNHPASSGSTDVRTATSLQRLAGNTARRRRRAREQVIRKRARLNNADALWRRAAAAAKVAGIEVAESTDDLRNSPLTGPDIDQGRRGLSTWWFAGIVAVLWSVNIPIAVPTFQVLEEPLWLTVLLALFADAVLILCAHGAGVTLRRGHTAIGGRSALGPENYVCAALLATGLGAAAGQAWVRWSYITLDGAGGSGGVALTTVLMLATFAIALWASFQHHHPASTVAERAVRAKTRAVRAEARARADVHRAAAQLEFAIERLRLVAQHVLAKADQILSANGVTAEEPQWLADERMLSRAADIQESIYRSSNEETFDVAAG